MRTICRWAFVLLFQGLFYTLIFGQQDKVRQLEEEINAATGFSKVEKTIQLVDLCLETGDYKKAARLASEAEQQAKKITAPELRAEALHLEGVALMYSGKKGIFGRDAASGRFLKSNEILRETGGDKNLILKNLANLKFIAEKNQNAEAIAEINAQIARLSGTNASPTPPTPPSGTPSAPATSALSQQNQAYLEDLLASKEAEISAMTEAQVKTELLLMQQRSLVDSMRFKSNLDSLNAFNIRLALREAESNRNFNYAIMAVLCLLAGGATFSYFRAKQNARLMAEKNKIIREEQQRSENLLLNILPSLVAEELKIQGHTTARYFEDVSVLFADFIGFSQIAERLSPQQLVNELDTCFKAFDTIIARYQLEKIKTIGDAYMCAGGLLSGDPARGGQLRDMVLAARDMQAWLLDWNLDREKNGQPRFDARIGIHRGPVVAGVVGSKKFAFDIWGDTVNIAARVEQAGESGKINISGEVFVSVKEHFPCEYRGKIAVKNKGEIDMYFVEN